MSEIINPNTGQSVTVEPTLLDAAGKPTTAMGIPPEVQNVRQMYFDRNGDGTKSRQQVRAEQRAQEKKEQAEAKRLAHMEQQGQAFVTVAEHQNASYHIFMALEKMAGEFRKLSIRHESLLRAATEKGILTREEFEKSANEYINFHEFTDAMMTLLRADHPLQDVVDKMREYNSHDEHVIKVEWHHVNLAQYLLDTQTMTFEEKLLLAAETGMPEAVMQRLREIETSKTTSEPVS